jgi:hypothetical protein
MEMSIVHPKRELECDFDVMHLTIMSKTFSNKARSGNMYVTEENKGSMRREVKAYDPKIAEMFPPNKTPIAGCKWAFRLEPMTSSFALKDGDPFNWILPKSFIEEATPEALAAGLLKTLRTNTYSTKLPCI